MCRRSFLQPSSLEGTFFNIQDVRTMKRRDGRTTNLPRRFRWQDDVDGNAVDDVGDNAVVVVFGSFSTSGDASTTSKPKS